MSTSDRTLIAKLSRAASSGLVTVGDAADALDTSRREAATKLASLARRGWLRRARRGLYLVLPLEAQPGEPQVAEDPWIVAREVFSPCYVGGWSAAEHWGITEQLFRSTLVVTAASVRGRTTEILNHEFRLFRVPESRIAGSLTNVWRGAEQVLVSSPERTLVDCLRSPELCGGIRHLAEMMSEYGNRSDRDFDALLREAQAFATGAAWKRLGYLAELLWPSEIRIREEADKNLTTGYARLEPAVKASGRLVRRWRLRVNVPLS